MSRSRVPELGEGVELYVELRYIKPAIWRRLLVPADIDFAELHDVLQVSMGWENAHLHRYDVDGITVRESLEDDAEFFIDEVGTCLGAVARQGRKFTYTYDFGDGWVHDLRVERIVDAEDALGFRSIECLAGARACPPEDCGGPAGYDELQSVMANPKHPEYRERRAWVGRSFDPEAFDSSKVNKKLATLAKRLKLGRR
jgi:Plasmid pRiA4b ORF-3-like protein